MSSDSPSTPSPEEKRALLKRLLAERASTGVGDFPLTHGQRALWFIQQLHPSTFAYNIALPLRFRPGIDLTTLQRTIDRLRLRHAALRTVFPSVDGQPVQRVLPPQSTPISVRDLDGATDEQVFQALRDEHRQPFALDTAAFTATLFRRADDDALLLSIHHIIVDAWSVEILLRDLHVLYAAEVGETAVDLPPLAARFSDFAAAEARLLASPRGKEIGEFWLKALDGELPVLKLAGAEPNAAETDRGASLSFQLNEELTAAIANVARAHGATLYTIILATTQALIFRLSEESDTIVGTPVALRTDQKFNDVVGYCVNTLPIRGTVRGADTFLDLLGRARELVIEALKHQDYPFSLIVDRLHARRDTGRNPVFQVLVNVLAAVRSSILSRLFSSNDAERLSFGTSSAAPYVLPQQEGQFELTVEVIERAGMLSGSIRYQTALYSDERATEIRDGFLALLSAAVANPSARVADLVIPGREQFEL